MLSPTLFIVLQPITSPLRMPELNQSLSSKVTEVTVYADRARVTRESVVDLPELARLLFKTAQLDRRGLGTG